MASAIAGIVVFLIAALFTLGTALVAPIGMYVLRRRATRRQLQMTRFGSWLGASIASSLAVAVLWAVLLFSAAPGDTFRQLKEATAASQARPAFKLPAWYTRVFPQAAANDSVARQMARTPGVVVAVIVMAFALVSLFCGAVAGTIGWVATVLVAYGFSGRGAV